MVVYKIDEEFLILMFNVLIVMEREKSSMIAKSAIIKEKFLKLKKFTLKFLQESKMDKKSKSMKVGKFLKFQ